MSRYIDADKFMSLIADNHYLLKDGRNSTDYGMFTTGIEQAVEESVATNVKEIIPCAECIYFADEDTNHQGVCFCGKKDMYYISEFYPYATDFCSYAERK